MIKRYLSELTGIPEDEVESHVLERYEDYCNSRTVFVMDDRSKVYISNYVMMKLEPIENPFVEGMKAIALALHEREKREKRQATDRRNPV